MAIRVLHVLLKGILSLYYFCYRDNSGILVFHTMANPSSGVYNFLSDENSEHWKGLLQPALRKVCVQLR